MAWRRRTKESTGGGQTETPGRRGKSVTSAGRWRWRWRGRSPGRHGAVIGDPRLACAESGNFAAAMVRSGAEQRMEPGGARNGIGFRRPRRERERGPSLLFVSDCRGRLGDEAHLSAPSKCCSVWKSAVWALVGAERATLLGFLGYRIQYCVSGLQRFWFASGLHDPPPPP